MITEVVKIDPVYDADKYIGFLGITRPLAFAPEVKPLVEAAQLERLLGASTDIKVVVAEPQPRALIPLPILISGIGVAVIGLLLLVIGSIGRRAAG
jgi:hypothetical protein